MLRDPSYLAVVTVIASSLVPVQRPPWKFPHNAFTDEFSTDNNTRYKLRIKGLKGLRPYRLSFNHDSKFEAIVWPLETENRPYYNWAGGMDKAGLEPVI